MCTWREHTFFFFSSVSSSINTWCGGGEGGMLLPFGIHNQGNWRVGLSNGVPGNAQYQSPERLLHITFRRVITLSSEEALFGAGRGEAGAWGREHEARASYSLPQAPASRAAPKKASAEERVVITNVHDT